MRVTQAKPEKFLFDNDFFEFIGDGKKQATPEETARLAAEQSYSEGVTEGRRQAEAQFNEQLTQHLGKLDQALAEIKKAQQQHAQLVQKKALQLTADLLTTLLGDAQQKYPQELLQKSISAIADHLSEKTKLNLRIHPATKEFLSKENLAKSPLAEHHVTVVGDPSLQPGDVIAEWDKGGLDATISGQLEAIKTALASASADDAGTAPAAPEAATEQPQAAESAPAEPQPKGSDAADTEPDVAETAKND